MRCFLPCFRTCNRRKELPSANAAPIQARQTHVAEGAFEHAILLTQHSNSTLVEEPLQVECIAESKVKNEKASDDKSAEVTFTKDKEEKLEGVKRDYDQQESSESLFSLSISSRNVSASQTAETEVNSPVQLKLQEHLPSSIHKDINKEQSSAEKPNEEENENEILPNHPISDYRYRNCSDEGYSDIDVGESDLQASFDVEDDGGDAQNEKSEEGTDLNGKWVQQESSESLFSLSTECRKRISSAEEAENEVNSHITQTETKGRVHTHSVCSVLSPIENLNEERVVKAAVVQPLKKDKENVDIKVTVSPEPSLKLSNRKVRHRFNEKKQEIGVDTSLSSWLVESDTTPVSKISTNSVGEYTPKGGKGSPFSHDERPILGALTVEEIRMYSLSTSTRRSRSRSPDETPIIGTVGSYWTHTGQNIDSESNKSGKDVEELKWSSTKLRTRLEGAFEASVAAQV